MFGIISAVIVVVGLVAAVAFYFDKKRREMWQSVAERYGFTYQRHDAYDIPTRYAFFSLFQRGHSRKASNCLEGEYQNSHVLLFDYRYTTGSGKNQTTHRLSALVARVGMNCPYMLIRPESFFDKVGDFLGFGDIDFEFEEFNRRFHVKGPDKKFAYDICHSGMMDYLMQHDRLTWELSGNNLLLYGLGTFDPAEIDYCLAAVNGFLAQTPEYLRKG